MSPLAQLIREEIESQGPISFARFMELALYHPEWGYYERPDRVVGRTGDYYTNVSVGPVFGELLGFRFARWLSRLPGIPLHLVEAGAHDGQLAADILGFLEANEPALADRIEYWVLEPSARRRTRQAGLLARFQGRVHWATGWSELPRLRGVIFSNELLDALPVHRLVWRRGVNARPSISDSRPPIASRVNSARPERSEAARPRVALGEQPDLWVGRGGKRGAGSWVEAGVEFSNGRFVWTDMSGEPGALIPSVPAELREALPDGFAIEVSTEAIEWWRRATRAFETGWLAAIDYGDAPGERLQPARRGGTLRAYSRHHTGLDVLADPGSQDLTAHVDFEAVLSAGEAGGLKTGGLWRQEQFLAGILRETEAGERRFPGWTPARVRQCQTLLHPALLGSSFKVLVQHRGDL